MPPEAGARIIGAALTAAGLALATTGLLLIELELIELEATGEETAAVEIAAVLAAVALPSTGTAANGSHNLDCVGKPKEVASNRLACVEKVCELAKGSKYRKRALVVPRVENMPEFIPGSLNVVDWAATGDPNRPTDNPKLSTSSKAVHLNFELEALI